MMPMMCVSSSPPVGNIFLVDYLGLVIGCKDTRCNERLQPGSVNAELVEIDDQYMVFGCFEGGR